MTTGRPRHPSPTGARRSTRENNFFRAMVGCSLAVHGIAALIFSHNPTSPVQHRPPTVYVDLVMAPVANPQRGSASVAKAVATPVAPQKQSEGVSKAAKTEVVPKGKALRKEATDNGGGIAESIANMRKKVANQAEQKEAEDAIAALKKKKNTPASQVTAAAGSPTGTGDEAGSAIGEWLQEAVKAKWNWPDRKQKDLNAKVDVEFDIRGKLTKCEISKSSSNPRFDDSLKRALFSLEPLPKALRKPCKETILFNLEDLQKP